MIGERLLQEPINCTECAEIFQYVGFDEMELEGDLSTIFYLAKTFVRLNNEVYKKLHKREISDEIHNEIMNDINGY